jgi:hypothetical protein
MGWFDPDARSRMSTWLGAQLGELPLALHAHNVVGTVVVR